LTPSVVVIFIKPGVKLFELGLKITSLEVFQFQKNVLVSSEHLMQMYSNWFRYMWFILQCRV